MKTAATRSSPVSLRFRAILRWALGATFLIAGALKLAHPGDFYSALLTYDVGLPDFALRLVAIAFPWLEVLCGGALLVNVWAETVGFLVAGMCLIFVLMLGQAVVRGLELKCGCFGAGAATWFDHPNAAFVRACGLLFGSIWLLLQTMGSQYDYLMPAGRAS